MRRFFWIILVVIFLAFGWANKAAAQTAVTPVVPSAISDDQVNAVAKQLFCPVCENTPLDVCPTQACAQWRELIRTKLSQGWSADQIKQYFAAQYGIRVLAEPPRQGLNWLAYIIPPVLMLVGVYLLYRAYLSMRKPSLVPGGVVEDFSVRGSDDDYLRRVEEELKKEINSRLASLSESYF